MGRGLSKLQQFILKKASREGDIGPPDILEGFFGWKKTRLPLRPGGHRFSPPEIGTDRYHKTMVTLSRSIRRLEGRGLVQREVAHWGNRFCLRLTDAGKRWLLRGQQVGEAGPSKFCM